MKLKLFLFLVAICWISTTLSSQKYFTKNGEISFSSDAPLEKIEAVNKSALSVLELETGRLEFAVLINSFHFEKQLMQEHFNENYMESEKYPKSTFKGMIASINEIDFSKNGEYKVQVSGDLTIHGVTNEVQADGIFTISEGVITAQSQFEIAVEDYKIKIPKVVRDNIAKIVTINVDLAYEKLEQ